MNLKKFISGVSALTIAASAFAGITAMAATTYSEDFSAVTDAGAWWDTINGDLTASITDGGAMQLVNGSTKGNRAASKNMTFEGSSGATINMDLTANRGDRGTVFAFTDGSGKTLFSIERTSGNYQLTVTDAAGNATTSDSTYIEKFHLNATVNYDEGTVSVKATDIYNNNNKRQDDFEVSNLTTEASTGTIVFTTTVRRGGTATYDNIEVAGLDRVITTPSYTAPSTALEVNTCAGEYFEATTDGVVYAPQKDVDHGTYGVNVDFMLDTDSSELQIYPYSSKGGSATTNTPIKVKAGAVEFLNKNTEHYSAGIQPGKWYRMTLGIENYANNMSVNITDIATGTSVISLSCAVRNASSMRFRQLKISAVAGASYAANVVIYRIPQPNLGATISDQGTENGTDANGDVVADDQATWFIITVANTGEAEGSYNTVSITDNTDTFNADVANATLAAGSSIVYGGVVQNAYTFTGASVN